MVPPSVCRSALSRHPASTPAWKRLTSAWRATAAPAPEISALDRGHWYELRHFARDRSSGAIALGAGLEFLGCHLLGLGGASLLFYTTCGVNASGNCNGGIRSRAAAWCTPTPSGSRSTCRGNWAAAGSFGTAFSFTGPDGSRNGGQFTPNPDYWTFEPSIAFSYLGKNWVASANFFYDINTKSTGNCCAAECLDHQR